MRNIGKILLAAVVLWSMVGVGLLVFYSWFDWGVITGFATWILAAGVAFAAWEVWHGEWSKRGEFAYREFEKLNSLDAKEGLRIIYREKALSKFSDLTEEEQDKVVKVFESMGALGFLVERGYIDKKSAIEGHRGKYIRCWYKARPLICYERDRRGKYGEGIEYLAKEAYKYQKRKFPKEQWVKLDGKVCEIDVSEPCEVFKNKEQ